MASTSRIMIELLLRVRGVFSGNLKKKLGLTLAFAKEERGRVCFRRRLHNPADVAIPLGQDVDEPLSRKFVRLSAGANRIQTPGPVGEVSSREGEGAGG